MSRHALPATIVLSLLVLFFASHALADAAQQTRLVGKLTAIEGKTLTLAGEGSSGNITVTCNESTKYRRDASPNTPTSFADLQVNQTLRVYYGPDKVATLVNITAANPPANPTPAAKQTRLVGKLTAIEGKTLTIAGEGSSGNTTVTCNESTKYRRDASPNTPTSFADLQVNQTLRVYYGPDNIATLVNITK